MRMQIWMGSLLTLGLLACGGPKGYVIQGEIEGLPDSAKVLLYNIDKEIYVDSVWVKGDCFRLQGCLLEEPQNFWLFVYVDGEYRDNWYQTILVGNEHVMITGDTLDFPNRLKVSGSRYQDQNIEFDRLTVDYKEERDSLLNCLYDPQYNDRKKEIRQRLSMVNRIMDSLQEQYLFTYTNTYPSLNYLKFHLYSYSKDTVQMLFDRMSAELQATFWAQSIRTYLESENVAVGDLFFDFEAEDQTGKPVRLSDFIGKDGKYVLLDFTSAGCGPCMFANREMRQMVDTYSDSLRIVSFSIDRSRENWLQALKRDSVSWTSLWSTENADRSAVSIPYRVQAMPTFFVIDPQGKIIHRWSGYGKGMFDEEIGWLKNKQ